MEDNINTQEAIAQKPKHSDFKCFIGIHRYEVYTTRPLMDTRNINIGTVIVNRCNNCGKIKDNKIYTMDVRF